MSQVAQIQLYIDRQDFEEIVHLLDADDEIAFLLNHGQGKWRAYEILPNLKEFQGLNIFHIDLWHKPAGGVPHFDEVCYLDSGKQPTVADPFKGWKAWDNLNKRHINHMHSHPTLLSFEVCFQRRYHENGEAMIGRSRLFWIGGRYETSMKEGLEITKRWWRRFKSKLAKISHRVPIGNDPACKGIDHLAFSSAYKKILDGQKCSMH